MDDPTHEVIVQYNLDHEWDGFKSLRVQMPLLSAEAETLKMQGSCAVELHGSTTSDGASPWQEVCKTTFNWDLDQRLRDLVGSAFAATLIPCEADWQMLGIPNPNSAAHRSSSTRSAAHHGRPTGLVPAAAIDRVDNAAPSAHEDRWAIKWAAPNLYELFFAHGDPSCIARTRRRFNPAAEVLRELTQRIAEDDGYDVRQSTVTF